MRDGPRIARALTISAAALAMGFALVGCWVGTGLNQTGQTQQLRELLTQWAALVDNTPPNAVIVTGELINGGGWNGPNADDQKIAFLDGQIQAVEPLPTGVPAFGQITWSDGSTQSVDLISAADALSAMIATSGDSGPCKDCKPLQVTAAHLTNIDVSTSRGDASVPVWQFDFPQDQAPMDPISFVALKNVVAVNSASLGDGLNEGTRVDDAYGAADSSELTLTFTGSPWDSSNPCGADYRAGFAESDIAVAVIVNEHSGTMPISSNGVQVACPAVGREHGVTIYLAKPLGNRTILDMSSGVPISLKTGPAPQISPLVGPLP